MPIPIALNFGLNSPLPLDDRTVVADDTARVAILSGERFEGLVVYVTGTQLSWQLQGGVTNSDWVEFGAGGNLDGGIWS